MTDELRMYTTTSGELPSLVQKGIPKCFVEYEQYLELKEAYEELKEFWKEVHETLND